MFVVLIICADCLDQTLYVLSYQFSKFDGISIFSNIFCEDFFSNPVFTSIGTFSAFRKCRFRFNPILPGTERPQLAPGRDKAASRGRGGGAHGEKAGAHARRCGDHRRGCRLGNCGCVQRTYSMETEIFISLTFGCGWSEEKRTSSIYLWLQLL